MALIKCSECGKEISEKASNCPNCGNPININQLQAQISTGSNKPIQAEPLIVSKKWKTVKLISWLAIILGIIIMGNGGDVPKSENIYFWMGLAFILYGFIALIISKIGAWYNDRSSR